MSWNTKSLTGECEHCGGQLEFPAEAVGTTGDCPHCGAQTELFLAVPKEEPSASRKAIVYAVAGILILVVGLVAALVALKRARSLADGAKPPPAVIRPVRR